MRRGTTIGYFSLASPHTCAIMRGMSTMSQIPGYCTAKEAANVIGKSHTQVCKYVRDGLLPSIRVGKSLLIETEKLESFTPPPRGNPNFRTDAKA
jgi:excisionase family DNA binding protein